MALRSTPSPRRASRFCGLAFFFSTFTFGAIAAEEAFREQRYDEAFRFVAHALIDEPQNGKLHLFHAQTMFALGRYEPAACVGTLNGVWRIVLVMAPLRMHWVQT